MSRNLLKEVEILKNTCSFNRQFDLAMGRMHDRQNIGKVLLSFEKTPEVRPEPEKKDDKKKKKEESKDSKKEEEKKADEPKTEEKAEDKKDESKPAE